MLRRTHKPRTAPDGGLRTSGWPVFIRLALSIVVLGVLYVALCWYAGRSVPPRTEVAGVSVGGLTQEQAAERLDARLAKVRRTPVTVTWPGGSKRLEPAALGLSVDQVSSVAGLAEFTLDPRRVWDRLTNGVRRPGVVAVDVATSEHVLRQWAGEIERPAIEGTISFDGGTVKVSAPHLGRRLDVGATRAALAAAWPAGTNVAARLTIMHPQVSVEQFDTAVNTLARPAVSGALTVRAGQVIGTMTPQRFSASLRLEAQGGDMVLRVDESRFLQAARKAVPGLDTEPTDAWVRIEPGSTPFPVVEPSVNGWKVQASAVSEVVQAALTRADRTAALKVATVPPSLTTEQVTAWGITAAVAQEHLPASGDPVTQAMLTAVVDTLDGTVLAPEATFLWTIPTAMAGESAGTPDDLETAIGSVVAAATSAGLRVTRDVGASTVTLANPHQEGVVLQIDRSVAPARFVVWGAETDR